MEHLLCAKYSYGLWNSWQHNKPGPWTLRDRRKAAVHLMKLIDIFVEVIINCHFGVRLAQNYYFWPIPLTKNCYSTLYCTPYSAYPVPTLHLKLRIALFKETFEIISSHHHFANEEAGIQLKWTVKIT